MPSSLPPAACTPRSIADSCWRKNWPQADVDPRRRSPWKGLRCPPHAAAAAVFVAVQAERLHRARVHHLRLGAPARAALAHEGGDRPPHLHGEPGRPRSDRGGVPRDPARLVRPRVHPDVGAADDGAADHVRHADADLRASAAAGPAVLRPQSRRAPDDARHDRRRRPERHVHRRSRLDLRRRLHAGGHHDRPRVDGLAAGAAGVLGAAAHRARDAVVPAERAGILPDRAHLDRAHQRVPPGAHHGHADRATVPARVARVRPLRRDQPHASRRQRRVDLLLRGVLSGDRDHRRARVGADDLVRRRVDAPGDADARVARRVHPLRAAFLPAHQRHVGEVQRPPGGDGVLRANLQAAGHAGDD